MKIIAKNSSLVFQAKAEPVYEDYSNYQLSNGFINAEGAFQSSETSRSCGYVSCQEGDVFLYEGIPSATNPSVHGYSDTNGNGHVALSSGAATLQNLRITIPNGVNYVRAWSTTPDHAQRPSPNGLVFKKVVSE